MSDNPNSQPNSNCYPSLDDPDRPRVRRYAVEPVETTARSSHGRRANAPLESNTQKESPPKPSPKKYLPIPIETSFHSNRLNKVDKPLSPSNRSKPVTTSKENAPALKLRNPRKFVPELIETSVRSRRVGDSKPATLPTDKTDLTPGVPNIYTSTLARRKRGASASPNNRNESGYQGRQMPYKPRRQHSTRPHNNTRLLTQFSTRQSSFTSVLESISSSESGSPTSPSKSQSYQSLFGQKVTSQNTLQLARTRESCDERVSGYLLSLAAKAVREQMRHQVYLLEAYPNEGRHELVEHFYDREIEAPSDNDSTKSTDVMDIDFDEKTIVGSEKIRRAVIRRRSSDSIWAVKEMQAHKDRLTQLRKDQTAENRSDKFARFSRVRKSHASPDKGAATGKELQRMRNAASPPMLGADLVFRLCPSPKTTKFEIDQKIDFKFCRSDNGGGLWGGYCVAEEPKKMVSLDVKMSPLIHSPFLAGDSFGESLGKRLNQKSSHLVDLNSKASSDDSRPIPLDRIGRSARSEALESREAEKSSNEFDDRFVSQVYNYLSLGYPSLAWQFDEELSRISKISVEELRQSDGSDTSGHIRLRAMSVSEDKSLIQITENNDSDSLSRGIDMSYSKCARWRALKIYILEWSRQDPGLDQASLGPCAWGVTARKGSWAI